MRSTATTLIVFMAGQRHLTRKGIPHLYVWSYLQVLRHVGILDRIAGMVVGIPTAIDGLDSPDASPTLQEIVLDIFGDRDIPVLGNVEFGHAGANLPMPVGIRVDLDAHQRTLSLLEPAVCPLYSAEVRETLVLRSAARAAR